MRLQSANILSNFSFFYIRYSIDQNLIIIKGECNLEILKRKKNPGWEHRWSQTILKKNMELQLLVLGERKNILMAWQISARWRGSGVMAFIPDHFLGLCIKTYRWLSYRGSWIIPSLLMRVFFYDIPEWWHLEGPRAYNNRNGPEWASIGGMDIIINLFYAIKFIILP